MELKLGSNYKIKIFKNFRNTFSTIPTNIQNNVDIQRNLPIKEKKTIQNLKC